MTERRIANYERFSKSLRNFEDWLGDAVPGAMDVDFMCERKGRFLIIEGKPWKRGVEVSYGQHKTLFELSKRTGFRVYLVGEDGKRLHICCYNTSPAPQHVRTGGRLRVWFPPERFIPSDRDGLQSLVKAWWEDASRARAA